MHIQKGARVVKENLLLVKFKLLLNANKLF